MQENKVQFQKGLSLAEFIRQYGSEEQCADAVFRWRWPQGFVCPQCTILRTVRCTRASSTSAIAAIIRPR